MIDLPAKVRQLVERGVILRNPHTVDVDDSINVNRIAPGAIIHAGCRLTGKSTSIGPSCVIGEEAPATIVDCQLGSGVSLKGGFFSGAVFLDGVAFNSGAHVRAGTLMEEEASCAHSVALKQTMLMPFVTLGSLINFCDCLMAGGTDRKNHSEVGSSYIHFNYTPNQDKATPSLIGDVPRGVMLDRRPVFLGGQGGMVGPARIEFGTIIAAGTICRKDVQNEGMLVFGSLTHAVREHAFEPGVYGDITRTVKNNFSYIGNLKALRQWYTCVRSRFMSSDDYARACHAGAIMQIDAMLEERIKRLDELAQNMERSPGTAREDGEAREGWRALQRRFAERWPDIREKLGSERLEAGEPEKNVLLAEMNKTAGAHYLKAIRSLSAEARKTGTAWLQSIVDSTASVWQSLET